MDRYYSILQIQPDATDEDIRRAYKKKAMECHPDRGGSEEEFRRIQEAYEILCQRDPTMQVSDLFHSFFEKWMRRKNKPKRIDLHVTLEEVMTGKTIKYRLYRKVIPSTVSHCHVCQGIGYQYRYIDVGIGFCVKTSYTCCQCNGQGVVMTANDYQHQEEIITFELDQGIPNFHEIRIHGKGDEAPNRDVGDVIFRVVYREHIDFKISPQNHLDVIWDLKINLAEFLTGFEREIKYLDGNLLSVSMPRGQLLQSLTRTMHEIGFKWKGETGDLIINIQLEMPVQIPELLVQTLETALEQNGITKKKNIRNELKNASHGEL